VFIEAKDDGGGGDNWTTAAISRAKLQSNHRSSPPTNHHPVFLQAGCPSCCLTDSVKALKGMFVCLFVCLGFNGTFSTNRLYRTI